VPNDEELIEKIEELENNEPAVEEPASVGSEIEEQAQSAVQNAKNAAKEAAKEKVKAEVKKKVVAFLLKNPYVLIAIGIILLFILIIMAFVAMDLDFAGIENKDPEYFAESCTQIHLTWETDEYKENMGASYVAMTDPSQVDLSNTERYEYKSYDFNSYISGIVWNDNNTAGDVNNDIVYQMMSIAARTRVVKALPDNCVVLRDYNPENFIELSGNEDKSNEIKTAVNNTNGIVLGIKNELITTKYDLKLDYITKYKETNEEYKNRGVYY